jgi:hypothetical protein
MLISRKRSRQTSKSAASAAAAASASADATEATPKNSSSKRHGGTGVSRGSDPRIAMSRPMVHTEARKSSGKKTATQPSSARKTDRSPSKKISGMAGKTGEKSPKRQKYTANPGPLSDGTVVDTDAMEEMVDLLLDNLQALDDDALPAHMKTYATEIWRAATQTQSEFRVGFYLYYVALRWIGTGSDPTTQSLYLVQIQSTSEYLDLCSIRFQLLAAIVAVFAYGVDKKNELEIIEVTVRAMVRHLKHHRECNEVQKAVNALEYSCQMIKDMLY